MRCNLRWLTEAVPLPNPHGSKVQLGNMYRSAYLLTVLAIYSTHVTATGRSVLLHERKAVRWRHVMQPQHCWQIPGWVAPVRQQCSTFPLVQVYLFAVVLHNYYVLGSASVTQQNCVWVCTLHAWAGIIILEIKIIVERPNTVAAAFVTRYITPNSHVHISCSKKLVYFLKKWWCDVMLMYNVC